MDIGPGPEEPWWGLPSRALAPPQPAARGGSEEGGPADLGWLWLGEHPWVLPCVPRSRGAAGAEPPLPCGFPPRWERGDDLLFLLQVLPLSNLH